MSSMLLDKGASPRLKSQVMVGLEGSHTAYPDLCHAVSPLPYYSRASFNWCWACSFAPSLLLVMVRSTSLVVQVELSGAVISNHITYPELCYAASPLPSYTRASFNWCWACYRAPSLLLEVVQVLLAV